MVTGRQFANGIEVDRVPHDVHGKDCADSAARTAIRHNSISRLTRGNKRFHARWVDLPRVWVRVDEDRVGADIADGVGGSDKAERGDDHLIIGLNTGSQQSQVDRRGPARCR